MKSRDKGFQRWIVNMISFGLFVLLSLTGLVNYFVLPRGYGARAGFKVSLRHFFVTIHEWAAILFIIIIGIHIALHWKYIKSNLERRGIRE
jgi:cytochrome b subunit of formate dehydrogenase